ncbi:hypothetical protein AAFF_G00413610 [Aldrovandia affinis]|uniref:Uncharacterized protein n=1 Tax=Aldrovandia affinis TaxID=143900 RepID=A0AAD7SBL0_9TELE|nr:hypothetical protein AAFF_G00413610 [Aldrovandia affinis]
MAHVSLTFVALEREETEMPRGDPGGPRAGRAGERPGGESSAEPLCSFKWTGEVFRTLCHEYSGSVSK